MEVFSKGRVGPGNNQFTSSGESGQDHRYGFGRLDVLRAIDFAVGRGYGL